MEEDIRSLLHNRAEDIAPDRSRRGTTLRSARRRRVTMVGATFLVLAGIAVGAPVLGDAFDRPERPLPPAERPSEDPIDEEEEPETDILVAEARDGSWSLYAGLSQDGETLSLSLRGGGCGTAVPSEGFILCGTYDSSEKEGFIFGPVHRDVATLELETGEMTKDVRLRQAPEGSGLPDVRFFVRRLQGQGGGTLVARDAAGNVVQRQPLGRPSRLRRAEVRRFVARFMERRMAGTGAERFLDADGEAVFASGGSLAPLYPEPPLQDFDFEFVDDIGDGTFEVGVRLIFERGSYGHTYFVHRAAGKLVISGGRSGLEGP